MIKFSVCRECGAPATWARGWYLEIEGERKERHDYFCDKCQSFSKEFYKNLIKEVSNDGES